MKQLLLVLVAMGGLAACATEPVPVEQAVLIGCDSYADTLNALAVRNRLGLVSGDMQDRVDEVVNVVGPLCDGTYVMSSPDDTLAVIEGGLVALIAVRGEIDGQ